MKPYKVFLAVLVLGYLIGAFVCADFNISHWSEPFRAFLAFLTVCGAMGGYIATQIENNI